LGGRGVAVDEGGSSGGYSMSAIDTTPDNSDDDSITSNDDTTINQLYSETRSYATNGISNASNVGGASSPQTPSLVQGGGCCGGTSNVAPTRPTGTHNTLSEEARAMQEDEAPTAISAKRARRKAWEEVFEDKTETWFMRKHRLLEMAYEELSWIHILYMSIPRNINP
jgi:hypothetical protein